MDFMVSFSLSPQLKLNEVEQKLRESQMKTRQLEMEKESVQRPPELPSAGEGNYIVVYLYSYLKKHLSRVTCSLKEWFFFQSYIKEPELFLKVTSLYRQF